MNLFDKQIIYSLTKIENLFLICLLCLFVLQANSQNVNQIKKHIKVKDYSTALTMMANSSKVEKNPDLLLLRAVCNYHLDKIEQCLEDLKIWVLLILKY
jgi:hypothetical protein